MNGTLRLEVQTMRMVNLKDPSVLGKNRRPRTMGEIDG